MINNLNGPEGIKILKKRRFGGEVTEALIEYCNTKANEKTLRQLIDDIFPYLDESSASDYLLILINKDAKPYIENRALNALRKYSNQEEISEKLVNKYTAGYVNVEIESYISTYSDIDFETRHRLLQQMEKANPKLKVNWNVIIREAKEKGQLTEIDGKYVVPPNKKSQDNAIETTPKDQIESEIKREAGEKETINERRSDAWKTWLYMGLALIAILIAAIISINRIWKRNGTQ